MNEYLFAGYSAIVVLIAGYVVWLHARLRAVKAELEILRGDAGSDED